MSGRTVLLLGILCLFVSPAASQVDVRVGIKQGANFASFHGDWKQAMAITASNAELNRRVGFAVGGLLVLDPKGPLSVQPEILAIWKGAEGRAGPTETQTTLNYVEVPVLLRYHPFSLGVVTTHLVAGPTVGLAVKAERSQVTRNASGKVEASTRTNLNGAVRSLEAGLAAGVQFAYRFSNEVKVMTEVRYRRGLTSAFEGDTDRPGTTSPGTARNRGVALTMGIMYSAVGGFW